MNRRLVVVSLIAIALSIVAAAMMQQYAPVASWLYFNKQASFTGWLANGLLSQIAGAQILFWTLLVAGLAGLGRNDS